MKTFKIIFAIFVLCVITFSCEPEALPRENEKNIPIQADTENEELPVDEKEEP